MRACGSNLAVCAVFFFCEMPTEHFAEPPFHRSADNDLRKESFTPCFLPDFSESSLGPKLFKYPSGIF